MRLIRLKLENFRQHTDTLIEFRDGMTAIVGANGTGKTTILEAITFALYGKQRATRDSIRFYWSDKKKFGVILDFQFDGKEYTVCRTSTEATMAEVRPGGNVPVANGQANVQTACERLLGLNYDQFRNSFCAEQKQLAFLSFKDSRRQEEVARMLGFDKLKRAEDLAKERRRNVKALLDGQQSAIADPLVLERELCESQAKLDVVTKQHGELAAENELLKAQCTVSKELYDRAEKWRELDVERGIIGSKAEGLKRNVQTTKAAFEEAQANVESLHELKPKEQEYQRVRVEIAEWEARKDKDELRQKLASEISARKMLLEQLAVEPSGKACVNLGALKKVAVGASEALNRADAQFKSETDRWHHAKSASKEREVETRIARDSAKAALDRAIACVEKGVCSECGQPIKASYANTIAKLERELHDAEVAYEKALKEEAESSAKPGSLVAVVQLLDTAKEQAEEARAQLEQASRQDQLASHTQAQARTLREDIAKDEAKLNATPAIYSAKDHAAARSKAETLEVDHKRFIKLQGAESKLKKKKAEHRAADKECAEAHARFLAVKQQCADLGLDAASAKEAIEKHQLIDQRCKTLEAELRKMVDLVAIHKDNQQKAAKRLAEQKDRAAMLRDNQVHANLLDSVAKEMRSLREKLNQQIGPDLAARASENLHLLTNGRYSSLILDNDFEATVMDESAAKVVISGGEQDVVALALRLALSELIQELNGRPMTLLVLDEIFGSLDVERRQSVLEKLASLKGRFRQILVISHIEEINLVADHAIYLKRDPLKRSTMVSDVPDDMPDSLALLG